LARLRLTLIEMLAHTFIVMNLAVMVICRVPPRGRSSIRLALAPRSERQLTTVTDRPAA
jgi:hypothetical protein